MPPRPGDIVELTSTTLAYGGRGVARFDGFVVFVRGALPGDRVRARSRAARRATPRRGVVEILTPFPAPRRRRARPPGRLRRLRLADARLRAAAGAKQQPGRRVACEHIGGLERLRRRADPRYGRSLALPQQDGVLVRQPTTAASSSGCTAAARGARWSRSTTATWPRRGSTGRGRRWPTPAATSACARTSRSPARACCATSWCRAAGERRALPQPLRRRRASPRRPSSPPASPPTALHLVRRHRQRDAGRRRRRRRPVHARRAAALPRGLAGVACACRRSPSCRPTARCASRLYGRRWAAPRPGRGAAPTTSTAASAA